MGSRDPQILAQSRHSERPSQRCASRFLASALRLPHPVHPWRGNRRFLAPPSATTGGLDVLQPWPLNHGWPRSLILIMKGKYMSTILLCLVLCIISGIKPVQQLDLFALGKPYLWAKSLRCSQGSMGINDWFNGVLT